MAKKKNINFIDSIAPNAFQVLVLVVAVIAAFFIGKLTTQVNYYENKAKTGADSGVQNPSAPTDAVPQVPDVSNLELVTDGDHIRGDENAKIAIIEYSDFDCPYCATFHETAIQAVEEYSGEVMWIYRHLPLEGLHPEAFEKAIASECAAKVGGDEAFWSFSDEIFKNPVALSQVSTVAEKIGINVNEFNSCLENQDTLSEVEYDIQTAAAVGVQGTPGNYVVNLETEEIIPLRGAEPIGNVRQTIEQLR